MTSRGLCLLPFSHLNFLTSFCLFLTHFCPSNSWLESWPEIGYPTSVINQNKIAWWCFFFFFGGPQFKLTFAHLVPSNGYAGCPNPRSQSNQKNFPEIPKQIRLKVRSSDLNKIYFQWQIYLYLAIYMGSGFL